MRRQRLRQKASVQKDFGTLLTVLERGPIDAAPETQSAATRGAGTKKPRDQAPSELVPDYLRQLETSLGDQSRFPAVYERLASDPSLAVVDFRALAKQFAKVTAKSKTDALKKIWNRHQSLLSFDAKARATDGRSAA
jgi:hypothetical protein